jgi:hypothetical protein
MEHQGANLIVQQLVQLVIENKLIAAIIWIIIMGLILRKIAKKDNDIYLKGSIFQKKIKNN